MAMHLIDSRAAGAGAGQAQYEPQGPPYPSTHAGLGGLPTVSLDVPILAVLIALYLGAGVGHMYLLRHNTAKGHKFIISGPLFGFSMARIMTCVLRIVWAVYPTNVSVAIAANIFVNLGIIIIFVVNILFAQRILRAAHPKLGWSKGPGLLARGAYLVTALAVVLLVIFTPWSFYTRDASFERAARDIQLASGTWMVVFCCVPLVLLALALTRSSTAERQSFGRRGLTAKSVVLVGSVLLCLTGAGFRVGTNWATPRPRDDPAWYDSKPCFYCFNFVVEIIITYGFLALRVDQLFHVPDGSSKRKTFIVGDASDDDATEEVKMKAEQDGSRMA